jgi:hypothetical protein
MPAHAADRRRVIQNPHALLSLPFHRRTLAVVRAAILAAARADPANAGDLIKHAPHLWGNKQIILLAARYSCGDFLRNVSDDLRRDRQLVCAMLTSGAHRAFVHASACLRGDKEIVLWALTYSSCKDTLHHMATRLWNTKDIVMAAVRRHKDHLKMASETLRRDPDVLRACYPDLYEEPFELADGHI